MRKTLPANHGGRDFIVGDIHGCFSALSKALENVDFDPRVDRLISVGDLCDRGPMSLECLRLLKKPWFYAVAGNHEELLIQYLRKGLSWPEVIRSAKENGAEWLYLLTKAEMQELTEELIPLITALPRLIEVADPHLPFQVLHAEASVTNLLMQDDHLQDDGLLMSESVIWGRNLIREARSGRASIQEFDILDVSDKPWAPGLSLTYVGHNLLEKPLLHQSHLFVDCGSVKAEREGVPLYLVEHSQVVAELLTGGVVTLSIS